MCPSLIEIGSKTAEKTLHKQTDRQTDKQTDTTKIMVTWPWTNYYFHCIKYSLHRFLHVLEQHISVIKFRYCQCSITVVLSDNENFRDFVLRIFNMLNENFQLPWRCPFQYTFKCDRLHFIAHRRTVIYAITLNVRLKWKKTCLLRA